MKDRRLYFYDGIAERFDAIANPYDLERRLDIVFDELLGSVALDGRRLIDVGCGTGWFSRRATERGARVVALDIGVALLAEARSKGQRVLVAADAGRLPFADRSFDVVVSSECIEHTLDPRASLAELCRITSRGGLLVVTVPNRVWHFSARIAAALKLRPYEGYEHWLGWFEMRRLLRANGMGVLQMRGFHLAPPLLRSTWPALRWIDRYGTRLGPAMLNIAVLAAKR